MSLTCTTYHYSTIIKRVISLFGLALFFIQANAQNLFANPGFEDINICTEYHAPCAPEAWFYIKPTTNPLVNGKIVPRPLLGTNLLLVPVYDVFEARSRSYVYTMLTCPLTRGEKYKLSFYINTVKRKFYNLDFYFSDTEPATRGFETNNISPTFSITENEVVAEMKQDWKAVEYYFTAAGNEQFCMLGNLSAGMSYEINDKMNSSGMVFYFLDEIKLTTTDNKSICPEYAENLKTIYAEDHRHTEYTLVKAEPAKPRLPVLITDTISIPAVFFETNSALLKPSFKLLLDSIIHIIPAKNLAKMEIIGHTDNSGTAEKNRRLAFSRAEAVKNYFTLKLPQLGESIFASGKGQEQPIAENTTEAGRTKNRRVEIILTIVQQKE